MSEAEVTDRRAARLFSFLAPLKSHLFAMVGVVAVCGIGVSLVAWFHIQAQQQTIKAQSGRIGDLVAVNKGWATWAAQQQQMRALEQENTRLLQDRLGMIETQSAETTNRLKELEASNAEVKELLGRKLPDDLRRVLEGR